MYLSTIGQISTEGGELLSTINSDVKVVFPPSALKKQMQIEIHVRDISEELCKKVTGVKAKAGPIVTIDPRRRKFHEEITLHIPPPIGCSLPDLAPNNSHLRLLCSVEPKGSPLKWSDVTDSANMVIENNSLSFKSLVSAVFWVLYCTNPRDSVELADIIFAELPNDE